MMPMLIGWQMLVKMLNAEGLPLRAELWLVQREGENARGGDPRG